MVGNLNPSLGRGVSFWSKTMYILAVIGLVTVGGAYGLPTAAQS